MLRKFKLKMKKFSCIQFVFLLVAGTLVYIISGYSYPSEMEAKRNTSNENALKIDEKQFLLNNKPFQILCGAIHYFRVTPDSYEDRIVKLKGMGLNSVDIYIPWNLHEPSPGKFSSEYATRLTSFLDITKKHKLYVILRPGPYICSEWDLGGLPSWLLQDAEMKIRSMYPGFTKAVSRYFDHLLPIVKPYQFRHGGPIIAFQIENEYGSFGSDVNYMNFVKQEYEKHELNELFFVCDNLDGLGNYKMDDNVLQTINFMTNPEKNIKALLKFQPDKPVFVTEFWDGWFTHWQEKHHKMDISKLTETLEYLLKRGASVNFYMLHGGTNFGFMNGANADDDGSNYLCDITSYDYDAPISEGGSLYTGKYEAFKKLIQQYSLNPVSMDISSSIVSKVPTKSYGTIEMKQQITASELFVSSHVKPIREEHVLNMEALPYKDGIGQQYGYIVYQANIQRGASLKIENARDYVVVLINGHIVRTVTSIENIISVDIEGFVKTGSDNRLEILVENAGRVNYGKDQRNQRKGILGKVKLDDRELTGWNIYPLQLEEDFVERLVMDMELWKETDTKSPSTTPSFYKGSFEIHEDIQDTYLKLPNWFKGVVFVNSHNLGRYWNSGPQKTLYVPKFWLTRDKNTIVVFDLHGKNSKNKDSEYPCIVSSDTRDLGESDSVNFAI